jgi:hypothetical protein
MGWGESPEVNYYPKWKPFKTDGLAICGQNKSTHLGCQSSKALNQALLPPSLEVGSALGLIIKETLNYYYYY